MIYHVMLSPQSCGNLSCAVRCKHHMFIFAPKSVHTDFGKRSSNMSSTAMEQATLGQYFTTRRKGLEGIHPAKRRKVDMSEAESDIVVRRSERSKKQAASSQTKINTRASKAAKRNAKATLNEESVQAPVKVVSEPTSLFDDHAFAEALIGKLSDAQRKRKMAASSAQREDAVVSVPKDKSSVELLQGQKNEGDMKSKPKSRRRTARSSKTLRQNSEKSASLDATEEVLSSQPKDKSSSDGKPIEADAPVEKEATASPSKTPPIVRRIGGGIQANPWIAEQAKMVLSRGRAAVNLSQKSRGKEDLKQQAGATNKSGSVENSKVNVNKAQEDLAKARRLIKSMRSLEKSASKASLSCTEDNGLRLHQVASSKNSNHKEGSRSLKDVPAYERFHALAQRTTSEASSTTLPLPYKYKTLAEIFRCTDTVLNLLGQRKEKCTFPKLRDAVQQMSRKRFEKKHLAQMKTVYPSALEFRQDKCPGKSSSFELTVEFRKTEESLSKLTLTPTELLARKDTFQKNLLKITKSHHQDFLFNLNPSLSVDDNKITRWHPKFHLDEVPDVEEGDLPQPPVVKTYNSAHDVLEKARDMIAPRVEKALKTVAMKEQESKEQTSVNNDNNLLEKKDQTRSTENTQNKNNLKNKAALKGISQDLLNKIRQKEARKIEESMMRDPLVDKKLAMKERLPDLCRILKAYFSAERKAAIPLEDATVKLSESYKTSLSSVQVEEHIRFMSQLVPEWVSVLTVRKCTYVKINKTADVNNVINKLMTKEIQ